jgi:hypothetical protein
MIWDVRDLRRFLKSKRRVRRWIKAMRVRDFVNRGDVK